MNNDDTVIYDRTIDCLLFVLTGQILNRMAIINARFKPSNYVFGIDLIEFSPKIFDVHGTNVKSSQARIQNIRNMPLVSAMYLPSEKAGRNVEDSLVHIDRY